MNSPDIPPPQARVLVKPWIVAEDLSPDGTNKRWWLELPPHGNPRHGPWDTLAEAEAAARAMGVEKFNVYKGWAPPNDPIYRGGLIIGPTRPLGLTIRPMPLALGPAPMEPDPQGASSPGRQYLAQRTAAPPSDALENRSRNRKPRKRDGR
jgi:hypothetical protein